MSKDIITKLKVIRDFEGLIEYLRDELYWPIEVEDAEDITFDYNPNELGIEEKYAVKINTIKQIRPLSDNQPWGLFYIEFESKKLPVVVLRRILRSLIHKRRNASEKMKTWDLSELIFISTLGEEYERKISFAHFSESEERLPVLRTFSWDPTDTYFHYLQTKLDLEKLTWPDDENDIELWREKWSSAFKLKHREVVRTSKQLATLMARLAVQIREQVKYVYKFEIQDGPLHKLLNNFKKVLIHDLKIDNFADMYAQTVAYGLFSARASHEGEFKISNISAMIPNTNPFLKNLFNECTKIGKDNLEKIDLDELGVRELIFLLKESNIEAVLQEFGKQKKGEDPVIHFYELFLKEYDPKQKVKKGVFYTPEAVVSFIVRSIDSLLQQEFHCPDGLSDISIRTIKYKKPIKNVKGFLVDSLEIPRIQILDPATGTGTFLKHVINLIKERFYKKFDNLNNAEIKNNWNDYVSNHILPRLFGFEIMMAPYTVAHLKLGLTLKETGFEFLSKKRLGIYLTNTLEGVYEDVGALDKYLNWLAREVKSANQIKKGIISVIIGNPPYSRLSENKSSFITDLMEDYKKDVKHEKKYGVLEDDYVKFIRFAQWMVNKSKEGILGYITNNSYLSGIIHRGMRKNLIDTFDKIFILNLHGSSRIGEKTPEGGKDENVFDIQQGVAISIFIKLKKSLKEKKVYYADLWGEREKKYEYLNKNDIGSIDWQEIKPIEPYYLFILQDRSFQDEYNNYWSIADIFNNYLTGVETKRDKFTLSFTREELNERFEMFIGDLPDYIVKQTLNLRDTDEWNVRNARERLRNTDFREKINLYAYRPFDIRWICYDPSVISRAKYKIMKHLLKDNLALVSTRMLSTDIFRHVFITKHIGDRCLVSIKTRETSYFFPLYIYELTENNQFRKISNFNQTFIQSLTNDFENKSTPEEFIYYIYALLFSPTYRERYNDLLKMGFPKIPLTSNEILFKELCGLGSKLVSLHMLNLINENNINIEFKGEGDNILLPIGKNSFKDNQLKINNSQYFEGIPTEIYNFYIGSYQVCKKWLNDRKGRRLTEEEISFFKNLIFILIDTKIIMENIDNIINVHGGWPIN